MGVVKAGVAYLSWKVQYLMPIFVKNSKPALSLRLAFSIVSVPSSQGLVMVGKPKGSAPGNYKSNERGGLAYLFL